MVACMASSTVAAQMAHEIAEVQVARRLNSVRAHRRTRPWVTDPSQCHPRRPNSLKDARQALDWAHLSLSRLEKAGHCLRDITTDLGQLRQLLRQPGTTSQELTRRWEQLNRSVQNADFADPALFASPQSVPVNGEETLKIDFKFRELSQLPDLLAKGGGGMRGLSIDDPENNRRLLEAAMGCVAKALVDVSARAGRVGAMIPALEAQFEAALNDETAKGMTRATRICVLAIINSPREAVKAQAARRATASHLL